MKNYSPGDAQTESAVALWASQNIPQQKKKKFLVISALLGPNHIELPTFEKKDNCDYILITDQMDSHPLWRIVKPLEFTFDIGYKHRRNAKVYKVLPQLFFPGYQYYIWHDCTSWLGMDPEDIITEYMGDAEFANFKHPERDCIFDEVEVCKKHTNDAEDLLDAVKGFITANNFPKNQGLYECTSFIRKNSDRANAMCLSWWELICKFSSRDQLSFPIALLRHGMTPAVLPGSGQFYAGNNDIFPSQETTFRLATLNVMARTHQRAKNLSNVHDMLRGQLGPQGKS